MSARSRRIGRAKRPPDTSESGRLGRLGSREPLWEKAPRITFLLGLDRTSAAREVGWALANRILIAGGISVHSFCPALSRSSSLNPGPVLAQHAVFLRCSFGRWNSAVCSPVGVDFYTTDWVPTFGFALDFFASGSACFSEHPFQDRDGCLCCCWGGSGVDGLAPKRCIGGSGTSAKPFVITGAAPYKPELSREILLVCMIMLGAVLFALGCCLIIRMDRCADLQLASVYACMMSCPIGYSCLSCFLKHIGRSKVRAADVWACGSQRCYARPALRVFFRLREVAGSSWPADVRQRLLYRPWALFVNVFRVLGLLSDHTHGSPPPQAHGGEWPVSSAFGLWMTFAVCGLPWLPRFLAMPVALGVIQTHCLAFGHGLGLALCLGLLGLLRAGCARKKRGGCLRGDPCVALVVPLASCARPAGGLVWRRGPSCARSRVCSRLMLALLGFSCCPRCVWAMPRDVGAELSRVCALDFDLLGARSSEEALAPDAFPNAGDWPLPFRVGSQPSVALRSVHAACLPLGAQVDAEDRCLEGWLWVSVWAPYYQPETWAIQVDSEGGLPGLCHQVDLFSTGSFGGGLHGIAPLRPQPVRGQAGFIRFPACLDAFQVNLAAVVLDLTRVGGNFHAVVFPRRVTGEELWEYSRPYVSGAIDEIELFYGAAQVPVAGSQPTDLDHGDVITAARVGYGHAGILEIEELFRPGADWESLHHTPHCIRTPAVGLFAEGDLRSLNSRHFQADTLRQVVAGLLDVADDSLLCHASYEFADLDIHGVPCDRLLGAFRAPVTLGQYGGRALARRDVFLFCDLRPLGRPPSVQLVHSTHVHLPTLAAMLGLDIPEGFVLIVSGFEDAGEEVRVGLDAYLRFQLRPRPLQFEEASDYRSDDSEGASAADEDSLSPPRPWAGACFPTYRPPSPDTPSFAGPSPGDPADVIANFLSVEASLHKGFRRAGFGEQPRFRPSEVKVGRADAELVVRAHDARSKKCPEQGGAALICALAPVWHCHDGLDWGPSLSTIGSWEARVSHKEVSRLFWLCPLPDEVAAAPRMCKQPDCADVRAARHEDRPAGGLAAMLRGANGRWDPVMPVDVDAYAGHLFGSSDTWHNPWANIMVLVFSPDRVPDVLNLPVHIPATTAELLEAVEECRDEEHARWFPTVRFADPQPARHFVAAVAFPEWTAKVFVLIDSRLVNAGLFCVAIDRTAHRESILAHAGFKMNDDVDVYCQNLGWALEPWQVADLATGDLLSLVPRRRGAPQRFQLMRMLHSIDFWDAQADLPRPPGDHVLLMTEGVLQVFQVFPARRAQIQKDIAALLGSEADRLTLRMPSPKPKDVCRLGYFIHTVTVATERLCRLPVPPARIAPKPYILAFDCRPILQAFRWRLCASQQVRCADLTGEFQDAMPVGWTVDFLGAPIVRIDGDDFLCIEHGLLVTVVPCRVRSSAPNHSSSSGSSVSTSQAEVPSEDASEAPDGEADRERSRSPRREVSPRRSDGEPGRVGQADGLRRTAAVGIGAVLPFAGGAIGRRLLTWMYMCRAGFMHVAPWLWSSWRLTPVIASWFRANGVPQFCRDAVRLLRSSAGRPRLNLAQRISRGLARPRGWQIWAPIPDAGPDVRIEEGAQPSDTDEAEAAGSPSLTICVLTPEFEPEVVRARLTAGATQDDVLWALRRRRMDFRGRVFPMVVLPTCQAAQGWLIALAVPSWAIVDTFAYFDLRAVDGRLFAECVPSTIDRLRILRFAGLDEDGEWDVFAGDAPNPLEGLQEVAVLTGTLLTVLPRHSHRSQVPTVFEVLDGPAHWEVHPDIPHGQGRNVCAVLDQGHRRISRVGVQSTLTEIFESLSLRADSARICHAHPLARDVTIKGFACQEVLAVIQPDDAGTENVFVGPACIFDCRGLLQGWLLWPFTGIGPCCADVRDLLEMFMPPSWELYIEGASRVQNGCWPAVDGQIFWASFIPADIGYEPVAEMQEDGDQPDDSSERSADASPAPAPLGLGLGRRRRRRSRSPRRQEDGQAGGEVRQHTSHRAGSERVLVAHSAASYGTGWCKRGLFVGALCCQFRLLTAAGFPKPVAEAGVLEGTARPRRPRGYSGPTDGVVPTLAGVPTPCRRRRGRRDASPLSFLRGHVPGPTLLEQSVAMVGSNAMLDACSLIEVLLEHFANDMSLVNSDMCESGHANTGLAPRVPCTIRLCDLLLPSPTGDGGCTADFFDLTAGQCPLPVSEHQVARLLERFEMRRFRPPPRHAPAAHRFSAWLAAGCVGRSLAPGESIVLTADGSYCPLTGVAGWGVVISFQGASVPSPGQFVGCVFGHVAASDHTVPLSAYVAEVCALWWASVVALQLPVCGPIIFRADNVAALRGVQGCDAMTEAPVCVAARAFHFSVGTRPSQQVSYVHVHGHQGDPANELADAVANLGAQGEMSSSPCRLETEFWLRDNALAARWLPHVMLSLAHPSQLPPLRQDVFTWNMQQPEARLSAAQIMRPFTRPLQARERANPQSARALVCRFVTYNAVSLLDPGETATGRNQGLHGAVGRVALLSDALARLEVSVAGLQETRTEAGCLRGHRFTRYCSGCHDRRSFGTELWVSSGPDSPAHTFVVRHADPWRLIGRLTLDKLEFQVFVGHAPHRGHSEATRLRWWAESARLCRAASSCGGWLFLVDGNCRVGSEVSTSIGDHQCDPQDSAGSAFNCLLQDCQSWVPATFAQHMEGPGGTLLQKLNNELQRSDYVGIPIGWSQWSVKSWVEPEVTSGHAAPDHFASVVECHFAWAGGSRRLPPVRIDPAALLDAGNHAKVEGILQAAPPVSWDTNVSDHASILAEYLYSSLAEAFPLKARRMRLSFLSAETSTLRAHAAALRHALRGRLEALRLARLRCAFLVWRSPDGCYDRLFQGRWLQQLCHVIAALSDRISVVGKRLRRFCRADKRRHVDGLADQLGQAPQGEVHIVLKRLLRPKKFRRRGPAPLPKLKTTDGSMCTTQEQVVETWRKHFSDLEGGVQVSAQELVEFGLDSQRQTGAIERLQASDVPDLVKLAATFRDVNPQKACGPDMIPPSLCRGFASQMSVLFYPVLLKTLAYISEPISMKGGSLFRIPKPGAADTASCSSQRAILVQSVLEKVLHKSVRGLRFGSLSSRPRPC